MRFTNKFPYTNINNINLDWIIKRVKELGETVLSYAQDIANAVALAEAAQDAADSVTSTAESAVTTAQAAEATANAIAGTANTALSTAQAAEETAQAAETTANAIAGTANTALATAQAAEETAQAAEETAQAAEERAGNAEIIAGTAGTNASNAVQTANTALATAQAANTTAQAANTTAQAANTTAQAAEETAQAAEETAQAASTALNEKAGALITSDTGAVVSFVPDRTIEQNLYVSVDIAPVQAGSGDPSPDNVRPISGWDSVDIWNKSTHDTTLPPTVTIQLGQTVYGGTLTIAEDGSANALVDRAMVDLGTLTWTKNETSMIGRPCFHAVLPDVKPGAAYFNCSEYAIKRARGYIDGTAQIAPGNAGDARYCVVRDDRYDDATATDFKTAVSGVQLVYELSTPIEIQLDPVAISTISGQTNNVWADAGDVDVTYVADLKWYIDSKIAELQALTLENGG